ncbi:MAG TPA: RNA-protein complex protein Nop10 [Candidatus Thermoplasmatota archaeon]|nr:RNA-protein complex protein Nop10 [Candidatus Thermoplasmatota archaeon]
MPLRVCKACRRYTLRDECAQCGKAAVHPAPARYSPEDRYAKYRQALKREQKGA